MHGRKILATVALFCLPSFLEEHCPLCMQWLLCISFDILNVLLTPGA